MTFASGRAKLFTSPLATGSLTAESLVNLTRVELRQSDRRSIEHSEVPGRQVLLAPLRFAASSRWYRWSPASSPTPAHMLQSTMPQRWPQIGVCGVSLDHLIGAGESLTAAQSADVIKVVRKLLTKSAPHVGQSLLACGLVASVIGCTRTRHGLPNSIDRLRRYFAHPFLNGFQRTRCRLRACSGHGFGSRRWPVGSFSFEHGIDLCLHAGDVVPTWAAVTRRNRGGECSCARYYRSHSHNPTSKNARFSLSTSLDHLVGATE